MTNWIHFELLNSSSNEKVMDIEKRRELQCGEPHGKKNTNPTSQMVHVLANDIDDNRWYGKSSCKTRKMLLGELQIANQSVVNIESKICNQLSWRASISRALYKYIIPNWSITDYSQSYLKNNLQIYE